MLRSVNRSYITFDIIRRILTDYFSYDILYVMNITDIDDKIIVRARHNHLYDEYAKQNPVVTEGVVKEVKEAWEGFVEKGFKGRKWEDVVAGKEKGEASEDPKFEVKFAAAKGTEELLKGTKVGSPSAEFFASAHLRDVLSPFLDAKLGSTVSDPAVFRALAAYWEAEFLKDMRALNVKAPDLMTRVSEYVPEIVTFVERIIANGFGYESNGSVYFDTRAFHAHPNHSYAKLEPWSASNLDLIEEGEGSLSTASTKRSPSDFALWKSSKPGEPAWDSPWGPGRPGWHIECSAMAYETLGEQMDVHSGGVDLAFPHHDNEIAQSEVGSMRQLEGNGPFLCPGFVSAWSGGHVVGRRSLERGFGVGVLVLTSRSFATFPFNLCSLIHSPSHSLRSYSRSRPQACFNCAQWTSYFLHAGHLHINGAKMSKSLKNFVTIADALQSYTARQIRLMFLLHGWNSVLDYKDESMREALGVEATISKFFANARAVISEERHYESENPSAGSHNHRAPERKLIDALAKAQDGVDRALCDSFDTVGAMGALLELVGEGNVYMTAKSKSAERANPEVLEKVGGYVTRMMRIFGCVTDDATYEVGWDAKEVQGGDREEMVMPFVRALSTYRDGVRELAKAKKDHVEFLKLSDRLRDDVLPLLGVVVDDREEKALVKLVDPEAIAREREEKARKEAEKAKRAEEVRQKEAEKKAARLAKGATKPEDMFRDEEGLKAYSKWDEKVSFTGRPIDGSLLDGLDGF